MFGESFVAALRAAGVTPDSFLAEYGARQFEVTVAPAAALVAADQAVITREMARAAAHRLGHRAVFSPMPAADGVGNGVHIHMSLREATGRPVTYDPAGPLGLSLPAQQFCAGVLHHLPAIAAITAPSPVSYLRLTPNRWAPTLVDIVRQDRGAALRVCPVFATAKPEEIAQQFKSNSASATPPPARTWRWVRCCSPAPTGCSASWTCRRPDATPPALPRSLGEALQAMEASEAVRRWFGPVFLDAYLRHKRSELAHTEEFAVAELCRRYAEIY